MTEIRDLIGLKASETPHKIRVHDVVYHDGVHNYAVILIHGFGNNEKFIRTEISEKKIHTACLLLIKEAEKKFKTIEEWEIEFKKHCVMFNHYPTDILSSYDNIESINFIDYD